MADVRARHPETGAAADVPEEAMQHLRQSGWLLETEYQENKAAAEAAAAAAAGKAKPAKITEEK
jgi:hypothetical protein